MRSPRSHGNAMLLASIIGLLAAESGIPTSISPEWEPREPQPVPDVDDELRWAEEAVANTRTEGGRRKALRRLAAIQARIEVPNV